MAQSEAQVVFKAETTQFHANMKRMNEDSKTLRQEYKLQSVQMKNNATDIEKISAKQASLQKQYDLTGKKVEETSKHLEKAIQLYGQDSNKVRELETELRRHQIAEQQLANSIQQTSQSLQRAITVEQQRNSVAAQSAQSLQELQTTEEKMQASMEKLNAAYELNKAEMGTNATAVDKLKMNINHLEESHILAGEQVHNLERQLFQAKQAYGSNSTEVTKLETKLLQASTAEQQLSTQIDQANNALAQQSNFFLQAGREASAMGGRLSDIGANMTMKVTAPLATLGGLALKTGMDFEASMSNVQAVSGATGNDLAMLEDKAREMGASTSKSASQAADALGFMALAGWDTTQMMGGLEPILRLSEAGALDLGRASDLVTDSMAALGLTVDELPGYLDKVAQASRKSNTNIDALMNAFLVTGGTLSSFNVPVEEATALLGILANRGYKGAEAGTAMNAIFTNLTSGAGAAGTAMKDLGLSAFDQNGKFKGLEVVLREVNAKLKNMTEEQQAQYISMIAGKEHLKTFQGLMAGLDAEYNQLKVDIVASDGALQDMAKTMQDNAKGKITELKSALEEVGISFSQYLIPYLTKGAEKITEFLTWFGELDDQTKKLILTIAGIATAAGPVLFIGGKLLTGIGTITATMATLTTGVAAATPAVAGLTTAFTFLTGPVGIALAATGALTAGLAYYISKNDEANQSVAQFSETQLEAIQKSTDKNSAMLDEITTVENLTVRFDELKEKSALTNEEFAEYLSLMSELELIQSPERIDEINERMGNLLEKSGLTNDEMNEFITANEGIIENLPNVAYEVDEYGNKYIALTENIRNATAAQMEMLEAEAFNELQTHVARATELAQESVEVNRALSEEYIIQNQLMSDKTGVAENINNLEAYKKDMQGELNTLLNDQKTLSGDDLVVNQQKVVELKTALKAVNDNLASEKQLAKEVEKEYTTNKENLKVLEGKKDSISEEATAIKNNLSVYEQIIGKQLGINIESGKGVEILQKKKEEVSNTIAKLEEEKGAQGANTDEIQKQIDKERDYLGKLDDGLTKLSTQNTRFGESITKIDASNVALAQQNGKIEIGKTKANEFNEIYSKKINKDVHVKTDKNPKDENDSWAKTITKTIKVITSSIPFLAKGTNNHEGGPAIVGEEGPELAKIGGRTALLNFGLYDLPRGAQIIPHNESMRRLANHYNIDLNMSKSTMGMDVMDGLVNGLKSRMKEPSTIIGSAVQQMIDIARKKLDIHSPSRVFYDIGWNTLEGQILATKNRSKVLHQVIKDGVDHMLDIVKQGQKEEAEIKQKYEEEVKTLEQRTQEDIRKIQEAAWAKKRKTNKEENIKIRRLQEDAAKKQKALQAKTQADINALMAKANKAMLDETNRYIQEKRIAQEISMEDEVRLWNATYRSMNVGTAEYWKARQEHQNALTNLQKEIENVNQKHANKILEIDRNLVDGIQKLNDAYENEFARKRDMIIGQTSLFEEFVREEQMTGADMLRNLQSQVDAVEDWRTLLKDLDGRVDNQALLSELESMGPKAIQKLKTLNEMTDEQLVRYQDLYHRRFMNATNYAEESLKDLRTDTDRQIKQLEKEAAQALSEVNQAWQAEIKKLTSGTKDEFKTLHTIGRDAALNLLNGLDSMTSRLVDQAKAMAQKINRTMADNLNMNIDGTLTGAQISSNPVKWHAKGGIFTKPTLLTSQHGVGEAGPEAVLPLNANTLGNIGEGIAATLRLAMPPIVIDAPVYLDGELVGSMVYDSVDLNMGNKQSITAKMRGL